MAAKVPSSPRQEGRHGHRDRRQRQGAHRRASRSTIRTRAACSSRASTCAGSTRSRRSRTPRASASGGVPDPREQRHVPRPRRPARARGSGRRRRRPMTMNPRSKNATRTRSSRSSKDRFGIKNVMATPRFDQDRGQHGRARAPWRTRDASTRPRVTSRPSRASARRCARLASRSPASSCAKGMPIGAAVTLRGDRMWEFADRLISVVLPRIRDFRGVKNKLDGRGNYSLGLAEQSVFPEIDFDNLEFPRAWTSLS